jgi:hypothetical protein
MQSLNSWFLFDYLFDYNPNYGCFVIIEPHTEVSLDAPYGARVMAWAEGPAHWVEAAPRGAAELPMRADLFGYR